MTIVIGVDEDDQELLALLPEIRDLFGGSCVIVIFQKVDLDAHPQAPICWMWDALAKEAVKTPAGSPGGPEAPQVLILLGKQITPPCIQVCADQSPTPNNVDL